ncbi:MAG: Cof-type HAD-IIB family hydrolase [Eubacteriales bacterium]|jgi:Cof subfamily protein (haloacid dehalogenase superfamily)
MKKFEGLLFVSDMDGTLLDDDKKIPQRNIEAIRYFTQQGGKFSISTGRTFESTVDYYREMGANAPIVCFNGSAVYDIEKREFVWHQPMDVEATSTVIDDVLEHMPHIGVEVYGTRYVGLPAENDRTRWHMELEHLTYETGDYKAGDKDWLKVIFTHEHPYLVELQRYIEEEKQYQKRFPSIRFVYSEPFFYEMLGSKQTKADGLRALAAHLGIPMEHTFAIGDNYNDLEMIREAGTAFAAANAVEAVRQAAAHTVGNNNQGAVADAIWLLDQQY